MCQDGQKDKNLEATLQAQEKLITALQEKEQRYLLENKYLRELYDRSPLGYQSLDEEGCLIETNKAWLDTLGYSSEEVIGHNFGDFLGEHWREHYKENFPRLKAVGEILGFEFEMIKKDGSTLMVNLDGRVGRKANGEFQQTYCIIKDITRQKKDEEERNKLQEDLQQAQKMESIGRLAGGIAHDLNNLLTPILGYSEMLGIDKSFNEKQSRRIEAIHQAGTRARDLVQQLLVFARKQTLEFTSVDMNEVLLQFENLLRSTVSKDIDLQVRPTPKTLPVMVDQSQIEQVILNLVVNATDAMPDGGKLTIETGLEELDAEYAGDHKGIIPGTYSVLVFSDTGVGMDENIIQHIFEPFFTTKGSEGTGLGLATVYGIIKQHNGSILVNSEPGKGTTFKVYLPEG